MAEDTSILYRMALLALAEGEQKKPPGPPSMEDLLANMSAEVKEPIG